MRVLYARRPASYRKYYLSVGSGKGGKWQRARSDRPQQGLISCVNRLVKLAINMKRVAFERIHGSELVLHIRLERVFRLLVCILEQVFWDR